MREDACKPPDASPVPAKRAKRRRRRLEWLRATTTSTTRHDADDAGAQNDGDAHNADPGRIFRDLRRARGAPQVARVVRCVEHHMGAGITPEEARALGWPPGEYLPETIEERIVCHADNLTGHTTYHRLADEIAKLERKKLAHVVERMRALHAQLARELGVELDQVAMRLR